MYRTKKIIESCVNVSVKRESLSTYVFTLLCMLLMLYKLILFNFSFLICNFKLSIMFIFITYITNTGMNLKYYKMVNMLFA